ncbi:MAG TPA: single-stranded DNA-binding protein [Negativicutes bacterium]|nr:single-stranded DNA-binding protein [Negativicutes bacterium]
MNLNKIFVLGNVTQDPQVRAMPSGQPVVNFSIATNRFYTDQQGQKKQEAEFHNIVAFAKMADTISRYVTKGSLILIEGRIKTRTWNNQQGVKQYKTEIIAEGLQLGPRPAGMGANSTGQMANRPAQQAPAQTQPAQKTDDIPVIEENAPVSFNTEDPNEIDVKDIPF